MISYSTLKTNLRAWMVSHLTSGVKMAFADQNAPAPAETYVTLKIARVSRVGNGRLLEIDETTGVAPRVGTREAVVTLNAIGDGAAEQLERILGALEDPIKLIDLQALKLGFVDQLGPVNDLTGVIGSQREERAQVDLRFRFSTPYEAADVGSETGIIEKVAVTNTKTGRTFVVNGPLS